MISYLRGKIKYQGSNWLIMDVGGVGYKVQSSKFKVQSENLKLKIGQQVEFYIYNHIREDRNELYGFATIEELQFFELLIGVNGVGPKMGMNILSKSNIEQIKKAILNNDTTLLTAIGGVGKKIASKIIIELKNKLGGLEEIDLGSLGEESNELLDAMSALGYKKMEIAPWLSKIPGDLIKTQEKVKWMLKQMK
ncbi:Holliday junction DNA helicase RuvA [Candidatus Berkelbacteria bacterium RIFCSPHIGHO2_12_FULL_36_9]|uniref:Holliday junction branch migration complex subunit RuvA n=1 Tax=Candidatus Berkelbacteria bacterium RIFCSPHIGHO2_12_FULL_36_9 TaxID=1797469 RepID=A0A1F5EGY1_9BACT|nr:MAG: Holliday junction DNA helicase RuvA [Candidatus Berkelbacteria bacterium RIFCSPHIGHO2_12_FULL_36_9]